MRSTGRAADSSGFGTRRARAAAAGFAIVALLGLPPADLAPATIEPSDPAPPSDWSEPTAATPAEEIPSDAPASTGRELGRPDASPTRVVIRSLDIDLPVLRTPADELYPPCDVAEYLPAFGLPGLPGVTYLYAHAQRGMFLPLLEASVIDDGRRLQGVRVLLYTDDDLVRAYEIVAVHRRVRSLDVVHAIEGDALVLQTSETDRQSGPKLMIVARPLGAPQPASRGSAHPAAKPRQCGG
jgi:hypothetical protein